MNILFIVENANLHGGTEILTFNLLHSLRAAGLEACVLSLVPFEGKNPNVLSLSSEEFSRWKKVASSLGDKLLLSRKSDRILRNLLIAKFKELAPKILVSQTYDIITALPVDLPVAQVFNWSVVGYESSIMSIIRRKSLIGRTVSGLVEKGKRLRRHRMLSRVQKLVVLTEAAKDDIRSLNHKVSDEQMVVIPDLLTVNEDSPIHSSLNNNNVVFVGRLSNEKGVMRLLRIWKRVSNEMPDLTLSIYGEGDARGEMEEYIREQSLTNVVFYGFCNNLESIYPHADLLLMTSDTEGFGMVLIEAMYYGVPCVSFDCPISPKEIISNAGVVVPCFDEEQYAEKVLSLLNERTRLKLYQGLSISRARDFYDDAVIDKWISLFS